MSHVYLIDLDRFSWVNNTFGHQAGDEVLVTVARALVATTPEGSVASRMGGDEFLVWVPDTAADMATLGEQLRQALLLELGEPDRRSRIRCSIGATALGGEEAPAQAISRADGAMYRAKRDGGDAVALADS